MVGDDYVRCGLRECFPHESLVPQPAALCNLILFSVTASLVNGKYYKTEFSELNKDADCGFNKFRASASSDSTTTAGAGLALCVISFILCIVQIVMYKSASASVSPA